MSRIFLLVLVIVASVYADPLVFQLKKFSSVATITVDKVEPGAKLYLASNDDNAYLKNIQITSGGSTTTLDRLNDFNDNGTPKVFMIVGGLEISTTNSDTVMSQLTGQLYVTTRLQADDPNFWVYVIKTQHSISVNAMKSTVVILNTALPNFVEADEPLKTSYVTNINQSPNTNLYFQWGIPSVDWHNDVNNTFFQNPVYLNTGDKIFFDNVEPLQIGLDYWYFEVMGPTNMRVENKYVSNHDYTTSAVSTTGLIVNNFIYQQHVVRFRPDETRSGISGLYVSAFIQNNLSIIFKTQSSVLKVDYKNENQTENLSWTVAQARSLTINSTSVLPGTFYCQYFTIAGELLPTLQPPTNPTTTTVGTTNSVVVTSTTTVATTTKGSSVVGDQLMIFLFVVLKFV